MRLRIASKITIGLGWPLPRQPPSSNWRQESVGIYPETTTTSYPTGFAWSWKLASLGIPVVLLYLGFLNAQDMANDGPLFRSEAEWTHVLKDHCRDAVDETCWGAWLDFAGVPLIALIRGIDQPFDPNDEEVGT